MNCQECRTYIERFLDGSVEEHEREAVEEHLLQCPECSRQSLELETVSSMLKGFSDTETGTQNARDSIMSRISQHHVTTKIRKRSNMLVKLKKPAFATGAIAAVIVVLLLAGVFKTGPVAYALEQTIEANKNVRTLHWKVTHPDDWVTDLWAEVDNDGKLLRMRSYTLDRHDGPKEFVWEDGTITGTIRDEKIGYLIESPLGFISKIMRLPDHFFNPRVLIESLYRSQAEGKLRIETVEPADSNEFITLTVTEIGNGGERAVFTIDPETKLIRTIEKYKIKGDITQFLVRIEYLEYDQPIDPSMFTLDIPDDWMFIDQTQIVVGLAQGDLTDEEVVVEVVTQFFEALIAKDYEKAGELCEGIPASMMEEKYGKRNFLKILSISGATKDRVNSGVGFRVPCKIEIEKDGVRSVWEPYGPLVRPVFGQPGRWTIYGGI